MNTQRISSSLFAVFALVLCSAFALGQTAPAPGAAGAQDSRPFQMNVPKPQKKKPVVLPDRKLTKEGKMEIIRGLTAELGYARKPFPFGKVGLTLKDGKLVDPTEEKLHEIMAVYGPSIKVGEPARISNIEFKKKSIIFDLNGGPKKKLKWYQHIQVSGMGGTVTPGQPNDQTNINGSYVELAFDKFVPDATPAQIKQLLDPVLNFSAKSATEAYLDTIPPVAKKAIGEHKALVGMNREMVTYALGRPPQKYRDKDANGNPYEEWIYGTPPQQVQFVRFEGDKVVRIETMKVDGTKVVLTKPEVILHPQQPEVAEQQPGPGQPPVASQPTPASTASDQSNSQRPSLRRPGEQVGQQPSSGPANAPGRPLPNPPLPDPNAPPPSAGPQSPQPL